MNDYSFYEDLYSACKAGRMADVVLLLMSHPKSLESPLRTIACLEAAVDMEQLERAGCYILTHWARLIPDCEWIDSPENEGVSIPGSIRQYAAIASLWQHGLSESSSRSFFASLVLSAIAEKPLSSIHDDPAAWLIESQDPHAYALGKDTWYRNLNMEPNNVRILKHASNYLRISDPDESRLLRNLSLQVSTDCQVWSSALIHSEKWPLASDNRYAYVIDEWLGDLKAAARDRNDLLVAKICVAIRRLIQSKWCRINFGDLHDQLIRCKSKRLSPRSWHLLYTCMGCVALRDHKEEKAIDYLYASIRHGWGPAMRSFGPNMSLAKSLLLCGQHEDVIRFLNSCQHQWKGRSLVIDEWVAEIRKGRTPDFGINEY